MLKNLLLLSSCTGAALVAYAVHTVPIESMDTSDATCACKAIVINGSIDGRPMKMTGKDCWVGMGTHAPSRVRVPLGKGALKFSAKVGIDDRAKGGSVVFRVWADERLMATSGVMRCGMPWHEIKADIRGAKVCTLEVTDAGDGKDCDHANWAYAAFDYEDGCYPPNDVRSNSRQLGILTPQAGAAPRINGATVFGVRPGHPILFHVPVTGERPMKVSVEGLERIKGLAYDAETHNLTGAVAKAGEYPLVFRAENAKGKAERAFTLKVGETIALTPAMGWNSWNSFATSVTADKVKAAADAMVSSGLIEHGWSYIVIDDFWQHKEKTDDPTLLGAARAADGSVLSNKRFPDMKGLADYVHARGLKAGLYSSPGPTTCGGCEGSFKHERQDAKSYADWGFDFLKYDWCSYKSSGKARLFERVIYPYALMGAALRGQKRDILFSLCQYGGHEVSTWGREIGGQSWRTTGDVFDTWRSISQAIEKQKPLYRWSAPGSWNDPDMLCVGKMAWNQFKGSRLAPNEQYTHISLWALVASPLMIGCDMTKLDAFTYSLLTNDEVIEIDQDPLGAGATCIVCNDDWEIWARPLHDGSIAAGLYNKSIHERVVPLAMEELGLECKWRIRDVWRQQDEGVFAGRYETSVPGHATHLVRLFPMSCGKLREGLTDIREHAIDMLGIQ